MSYIDRLIIVGAPSCCGKSMFIRRLLNGELDVIAAQLNMGDVESWAYKDTFYVDKAYTRKLLQSPVDKLVLHWTIPHPSLKLMLRNIALMYSYDKQERIELLNVARRIEILTLYASPDILRDRVDLRHRKIIKKQTLSDASLMNHINKYWSCWGIKNIYNVYSDTNKLIKMYDRWFEFCNHYNSAAKYLVNVLDYEPIIEPISEWESIKNNWIIGSK